MAHAHDISYTFSLPHTNHFQYTFPSSMGCSEGKSESSSIFPTAQCSENYSALYKSYGHHKFRMGNQGPSTTKMPGHYGKKHY